MPLVRHSYFILNLLRPFSGCDLRLIYPAQPFRPHYRFRKSGTNLVKRMDFFQRNLRYLHTACLISGPGILCLLVFVRLSRSGTGRWTTPYSPPDATQMLLDWRRGDPAALEQLMPTLYEELRRLAARYLRRQRADHTLQATALVH